MIDTINGAASSAIIYSIAETAKANNLKPFDYFVNICWRRFQNIQTIEIQIFSKSFFPSQKHYRSISESLRRQRKNDTAAKSGRIIFQGTWVLPFTISQIYFCFFFRNILKCNSLFMKSIKWQSVGWMLLRLPLPRESTSIWCWWSCWNCIIWGMICATTTPSTMRLSNSSTFQHIFSLMLPLDKLMFL